MAGISIGDAVGAGFGLIRRRPGSVLVWGLVQAAMFVLSVAAMAPLYSAMFGQLAQLGQGAAPAPSDVRTAMQYQSLSNLLSLVSLFVNAMIYCAVFRAIIHPDRSRFWYLRVGVTELMLSVLMIGFFIVFFVALLVIIFISALIIGLLSAMHAVGAAILVGVLIGAGCLCAWIYFALRFSLMGPMMVDDGKIHITDAWTATKDKAASLFAIGVAVFAIVFGLEIIVLAVAAGLSFGMLQAVAGSAQAIPEFLKQNPKALPLVLSPVFLVLSGLAIPVYGALHALISAPWARAYQDLKTSPADAF